MDECYTVAENPTHRKIDNNNNNNSSRSNMKKRQQQLQQQGAISGRIAMFDDKKKKNGGMPKLCLGCGVEMVSSSSSSSSGVSSSNNSKKMMMTAGELDAISSDYGHGQQRTKKQEKKARYADVLDKETTPQGNLCQRCVALQSGNVMDAYDALKDVDASVFMNQLSHVVQRRKFGICLVVVDATDPEFSSVRKLRDAIKSTSAILVINKMDLLPRKINRV